MSPYLVWCPDHDETRDDAVSIDAHGAEWAAEAWLRRDNDDGSYTDGDSVLVCVLDPATGTETRWRVSAEIDVRYSASEVSDG
jgi:hypothetical protein